MNVVQKQSPKSIILTSLFLMACYPTISNSSYLRQTPDLSRIVVWERTGDLNSYDFTPDSSALTKRIDPLSFDNSDFSTTADEYYDVYYSNADATFNWDGEYITVSCMNEHEEAEGGHLNLAEVGLLSTTCLTQYASYVSSFVAFGKSSSPEIVGNAVDHDLDTWTVMGSTVGTTDRLSVTVGFIPEPATLLLLGLGGILLRRRGKG